MKICNSEIIKKIKELEEEKYSLLSAEERTNYSKYINASDKIQVDYNFTEARQKIEKINEEIRKCKYHINLANATIIVPEFGITIGECLVYLAQLNKDKLHIEDMANKEKKSRTSLHNGTIEYTELNYDPTQCRQYLKNMQNKIYQLQLCIDRANLTNNIEI